MTDEQVLWSDPNSGYKVSFSSDGYLIYRIKLPLKKLKMWEEKEASSKKKLKGVE
jgi:hypothetical protein